MTDARFVLLEPRLRNLSPFKRLSARICRNRDDIAKTLENVSAQTLWIAFHRKSSDAFLKVVSGRSARADVGQLLALKTPDADSIPSLQCYFPHMVGIGADFQFLPDEELVDVLAAPSEEARDLFIGGRVDHDRQTVVLIRGDMEQVVVPLSSFWPNLICKPDPTRFALIDYGSTVCLGEYEASNHSILYEIDADYRRRFRAKRAAEDRTFAASLRRLRRLKGLTRDDFAPVSSKEIARIERDEIGKPHAKTIKTIAARLGVKPGDIETY